MGHSITTHNGFSSTVLQVLTQLHVVTNMERRCHTVKRDIFLRLRLPLWAKTVQEPPLACFLYVLVLSSAVPGYRESLAPVQLAAESDTFRKHGSSRRIIQQSWQS